MDCTLNFVHYHDVLVLLRHLSWPPNEGRQQDRDSAAHVNTDVTSSQCATEPDIEEGTQFYNMTPFIVQAVSFDLRHKIYQILLSFPGGCPSAECCQCRMECCRHDTHSFARKERLLRLNEKCRMTLVKMPKDNLCAMMSPPAVPLMERIMTAISGGAAARLNLRGSDVTTAWRMIRTPEQHPVRHFQCGRWRRKVTNLPALIFAFKHVN